MTPKTANIFIIEDDQFFASMLSEKLKKENFNNLSIYNSGEAAIEALHNQPDIVILDHGLGKLSGLDVLKHIKSTNPNTPVIFLSAQEQMDVAIQALKYGAYDYLEKNGSGLRRLSHLMGRVLFQNKVIEDRLKLKRQYRYFLFGLLFVEAIIFAIAYFA